MRLFTEHPHALGMSWAGHGRGAIAIGGTMIAAGVACVVHAIVPGWFAETAGRTVKSLNEHMERRRSNAPDPRTWPDYEI